MFDVPHRFQAHLWHAVYMECTLAAEQALSKVDVTIFETFKLMECLTKILQTGYIFIYN